MSENDQKQINVQVMDEMRKSGAFFDLHARLLANLAEEIQKSDIDGLKPYKKLRKEQPYEMAMECVLRYLEKRKMQNTIRAIQAESNNSFKKGKDSVEVILNIDDTDDPIAVNLQYFQENLDTIFFDNRDDLRADLSERLSKLFAKKK